MPPRYVTQAQYDELESRVASLEERVSVLEDRLDDEGTPPDPTTPPPIDVVADGIQAKRIASLIESFGVNTFSSMDEHNVWGSWPADYRPESVLAGLRHILGYSGHAFRIREYHYANRLDMQRQWLPPIVAGIPGTEVALCIAANGSINDVPSMMALARDPANGVKWVEGLNEPNTNFGSGEVSPETTLKIQQAIGLPQSPVVMGPSIVAGTPHPEGWITGYAGNTLTELNTLMHWGNGHYYPPSAPDMPTTGYSVNEYIGGLWDVYAKHPIALTEFHPTLYNSEGNKPDQPGWDGHRDAFYTLTTLLRCAQNGTMGLWWYALYDYGTTYLCGLFPKDHANDPRPVATALKALCQICHDTGDRRGFAPGVLDIVVSGLELEMDYDVYQASDGRFLVPLWYAAKDLGTGAEVEVEIDVRFEHEKKRVAVYAPLGSSAAIETQTNVMGLALTMVPGVLVLEIHP